MNSNQTKSALISSHLKNAADDKVDGTVEIPLSNQILSPFKLMQLYHKQNKHADVLNVVNDLKVKNSSAIDNDILSLAVSSAAVSSKSQIIIDLIDFRQLQGMKITYQLGLSYIKACRMSPVAAELQVGGWSRAVGMLDTITTVQTFSKGKNHKSKGKIGLKPLHSAELGDIDVIADCFEETLLLCAGSGKWRNVIDIIEKAHANKCPLTEKMLSAAVVCCARERNGIKESHKLFRVMVMNNIHRSLKVYTALLQGIVNTEQWDLYELVWDNLMIDNLPQSDAVYASRIEYCSVQEKIEEAESVLKEALLSIKRPKQSYNALYVALLKSGDEQKALELVKNMSENGFKLPQKHTASFHLQSLAKAGLVEQGLQYLKKNDYDDDDIYVCQNVSGDGSDDESEEEEDEDEMKRVRINDGAWQSLFRAAISNGRLDIAEEILDFAVEKQCYKQQRDSVLSSSSCTISNPTQATPSVDTTQWVPQIFRAVGETGNWQLAIAIADKQTSVTNQALTSLLKVLCLCNQEDQAVLYHNKVLLDFSATLSTPSSAAPSSSSTNGSIKRIEGFLRSVSHAFIQQLAVDNRWDQVLCILDAVHTATSNYPLQSTLSKHSQKAKASQLSMMYTSSMKETTTNLRSQGQALRLMGNMLRNNVTPTWSCSRYAMKALENDNASGDLLKVFACRVHSTDYVKGDEVAYARALRACNKLGRFLYLLKHIKILIKNHDLLSDRTIPVYVIKILTNRFLYILGLWQDSLEILTFLLEEKQSPAHTVFELTLQALANHNQSALIVNLLSIMEQRKVHPTSRILAICSNNLSPRGEY
jgi:pentatricopeptide repeat protein